MLPLLRESLIHAADLLWPRSCFVCHRPILNPVTPQCLCETCYPAITTDPHPTCPRCTSTVGPHSDTSAGCPRCKPYRLHFTSAQRLGEYGGPLRDAILHIKQRGHESLAEVLGLAWAEARKDRLLTSQPQVIVPVPLHWSRRLRRGFNQVESIAQGLAIGLKLPWMRAIRRVRSTPLQSTLSPTDRRENVKGVFAPKIGKRLRGLRVLLVDDVLTTGATADAASVAILASGAAQVDVAVLAHR